MAAESSHFARLTYAPEKLAALFANLIASPDGLLLIAEYDGSPAGVFAGCVVEHWMSTDRIATDFGLFVLPRYRGRPAAMRFARAYQRWARERGALIVTLGISTGVHVEQTARFYRALGFTDAGLIFEVPHV
ncbi:GNAT family N-acetyltransferase [Burkholderia plantarii]|nr:GNAT family N-acetyltransferase [Burkholderia plantarii]